MPVLLTKITVVILTRSPAVIKQALLSKPETRWTMEIIGGEFEAETLLGETHMVTGQPLELLLS